MAERRIMLPRAHRVFQTLFGLVLMLWAGMGVFGWVPPPVRSEAQALHDAIFASGYMISAVLIVYFVVGLAYLSNRFVALASVLLVPVSVNILLFHALLNPTPRSLGIASALFLGNAYMLFRCRAAYAPLLTPGIDGQ
jgi:putative oxidoreductase